MSSATTTWAGDTGSRYICYYDAHNATYVCDDTGVFMYDNWEPIVKTSLNSRNLPTMIRTYTWGLDLSGSLEGAGGIGGLAAVRSDADNATYYPGYDGNGNIRALISDNGTLAAKFEYSPFGRTLAATGPAADACPFGFSTKYADHSTGIIFFGVRHYNPETGRWLNRDPVDESGGLMLYAFCGNAPIHTFDPLGESGAVLKGAVIAAGACAAPALAMHIRTYVWDELDDKYKHCLVSCRTSKLCGRLIATVGGWVKELRDEVVRRIGWSDDGWDWEDEGANLRGRECAGGWSHIPIVGIFTGQDCHCCCVQFYKKYPSTRPAPRRRSVVVVDN